MPNGIDRNWIRFCRAVEGFRSQYNSWPTRMRLSKETIEFLFRPESWAKLNKTITLIDDGAGFIAEDENGNRCTSGQPMGANQEGIDAEVWLGVTPDSDIYKAHIK